METHSHYFVCIYTDEYFHIAELVGSCCLPVIQISWDLTRSKLPLHAICIYYWYTSWTFKPGLLPSRDRICALGSSTPSKDIPLLHHRYTSDCPEVFTKNSNSCRNIVKARLLDWSTLLPLWKGGRGKPDWIYWKRLNELLSFIVQVRHIESSAPFVFHFWQSSVWRYCILLGISSPINYEVFSKSVLWCLVDSPLKISCNCTIILL